MSDLISAAAEAQERFGDDELERWTAQFVHVGDQTFRPALVAWDEGPPIPCLAEWNMRTGGYARWNGFVAAPWFDRAGVEAIIKASNGPGFDIYWWVTATGPAPHNTVELVACQHDQDEPATYDAPRTFPDGRLRWCIGGWSYAWMEVTDADEAP